MVNKFTVLIGVNEFFRARQKNIHWTSVASHTSGFSSLFVFYFSQRHEGAKEIKVFFATLRLSGKYQKLTEQVFHVFACK